MTITDPRIDAADALGAKVDQPAGQILRADVLAELKVKVEKPDVTYPVRTRPGWAVRYSTNVDADMAKLWADEVREPDGGIDQFRYMLVVLAGLCRSLIRQDEDLGITFAHPEMMDTYGALLTPECVRSFYGDDTLVTSTYTSLLEQTGAGERLDPTTGSSV